MQKLGKNLEQNLQAIQNQYQNSSDLFFRVLEIGNQKIAYLLLESVSSDDKISNFLLKSISYF